MAKTGFPFTSNPLFVCPDFHGETPLRNAVLDGEHFGLAANAWVKSTPLSASFRMLGVWTFPAYRSGSDNSQVFRSSMTRKRTFILSVLAACNEVPSMFSDNKRSKMFFKFIISGRQRCRFSPKSNPKRLSADDADVSEVGV